MLIGFLIELITEFEIWQHILIQHFAAILASFVSQQKRALNQAHGIIKIMSVTAAVKIKQPHVVGFYEKIVQMEIAMADAVNAQILRQRIDLCFNTLNFGPNFSREIGKRTFLALGKLLGQRFAPVLNFQFSLVGTHMVNSSQQITNAHKEHGVHLGYRLHCTACGAEHAGAIDFSIDFKLFQQFPVLRHIRFADGLLELFQIIHPHQLAQDLRTRFFWRHAHAQHIGFARKNESIILRRIKTLGFIDIKVIAG